VWPALQLGKQETDYAGCFSLALHFSWHVSNHPVIINLSKECSSFELCRLLVIFPGRPLSFAWFILIRIFVCCCCFYNDNGCIIRYYAAGSCRKFRSFRFCQCLIFMTWLENRYSHQIRHRLQRLTLAPICLWSAILSYHNTDIRPIMYHFGSLAVIWKDCIIASFHLCSSICRSIWYHLGTNLMTVKSYWVWSNVVFYSKDFIRLLIATIICRDEWLAVNHSWFIVKSSLLQPVSCSSCTDFVGKFLSKSHQLRFSRAVIEVYHQLFVKIWLTDSSTVS
jgi:hypothetical protein